MTHQLNVSIEGWADGERIPAKYAFGQVPNKGNFEFGGNFSPSISWSNAPENTQSFVILCHDPDVPSIADDVNQEGKIVSADLPRVDFYHWVLIDIPPTMSVIPEGVASSGVIPKGKIAGKKDYGVAGINNYTNWFEGDDNMGGIYADYDGPCPPWNDSIIHHYHFTVYALDIASLRLSGHFGGPETIAAMKGHILSRGSYIGTYTMNPDVT